MRELISTMSGTGENVIAVNKAYLEFMGSLEGGVFLSQLIFFSDKSKRTDGYFYKTYAEWKQHTYLSEYAIRKQVKTLVEKGVLETKIMRANGNPTVHYKFNIDGFIPLFISFLKNRRNETEISKPIPLKTQERNLKNKDSITEISTDITTENTNIDNQLTSSSYISSYYKQHLLEDLTPQQLKQLEQWLTEFDDDAEKIIFKAIEKTAEFCPTNVFGYVSTLLKNWHQSDYRTLSDIEQQEKQFEASKQRQQIRLAPVQTEGHYQGLANFDF